MKTGNAQNHTMTNITNHARRERFA